MGKRVVYVGGLNETVSDNGLRDLFNKYGTVSSAYIVRHKTPTSQPATASWKWHLPNRH